MILFRLDTKSNRQYDWAVNFERRDGARSSIRHFVPC